VEIPISLFVGFLLISLGVGAAGILRTYMNAGRILAIERILDPMPEVHRSAAEMRARMGSAEKQLDEVKKHLDSVRKENLDEHKIDRQENARAHEKLARLITDGTPYKPED
jgi:biopolymer transport protein ExbB/TolQ